MMRRPRFVVPSAGPSLPRTRSTRMLGLLAARNELERLPGYLANVAPHVDGIVALDDGSTDGTAEYLESRPEVLEVLRVPPERTEWDETGNHRELIRAALEHGAEWALCV